MTRQRLYCSKVIVGTVLSCLTALPSFADTCVDCHSNPAFRVRDIQLFQYFNKWQASTHAQAGVTCANCHGGDPTAAKKHAAHPKHLGSSDPKSRIYFRNLPSSCGQCHQEVVKYFYSSKHYERLQEGEGPHCVTCHGSMKVAIPQVCSKSPGRAAWAGLPYHQLTESICLGCHDGKGAPNIIPQAERALNMLNSARGYVGWFNDEIDAGRKQGDRTAYEMTYRGISSRWHRFDLNATETEAADLVEKLRAIYDAAETTEVAGAEVAPSLPSDPGRTRHREPLRQR